MNWDTDDEFTDSMLYKHDQDLYRGNGKPGITTRLSLLESDVQQIKDNWKKRDAQLWAIILMMLGLIASAVWNDFIKPDTHTPQVERHSYID